VLKLGDQSACAAQNCSQICDVDDSEDEVCVNISANDLHVKIA